MNLFGQILTGDAVEEAVRATLKLWQVTYIAELERQTGRPAHSLPTIRSWEVHNEFTRWPEEQLPAVIIVSPGTNGEPQRRGDGTYHASWDVGVACITSAATKEATHDLAMLYAAAMRAALVQRPSLGGFASGTYWKGESYDDLPSERERSLGAAFLTFEVHVENVVNAMGGPPAATPTVDPYVDPGDWPEVSADPALRKPTIQKETVA